MLRIIEIQNSQPDISQKILSERFLIFLVKLRFISICPKQDVRHPVRRSSHLFADDIQINSRAAFDDKLIMNVTDDEAVPESLHGVAEDVAADGL